jgi:hypothetical protein
MKKNILFTVLFSFLSNMLFGQAEKESFYGLQKIEERFKAQTEAYPQERVHLHTDRDFYMPGEKIWFKAYVADANTLLNITDSYYIYVELISPADTLANRVLIKQTDGMFYGYISVSENVTEGDHTLRAYTRYMENLGDDYFFKKNIRITSPQPSPKERERGNRGRSGSGGSSTSLTDRIGDNFDVSFFPEGGNLPEGVLCKVAFKALNRSGYPEPVAGLLIDETGAEIFSTQTFHAGIGVFAYLPEKGKRYFLKCTNGDGMEKQFELPQPDPHARSLAVSMQSNRIRIGIQKSVDAPDIPCYLLVHCRGSVLFFSEWNNSKQTASLMVEDLPAGVIQFVLFDKQMNPLSERLVFSKNNATIPVGFHTDKDIYQIRDKIISSLSLAPSFLGRVGETLSHFSIAVTDDNDITIDESTTILSSLLLSSELKGYIENPAYYLQDPVAMDLLMMTHGWRRYNVPEVVKGNIESSPIPFQQYQSISGQVNRMNFFNRPSPAPDSEISIVMKGGGFGIASTDVNGKFIVPKMEFSDSTTFYLQALTEKGSENVRLTVDNDTFPALVYAPHSPLSKFEIDDQEIKDEPVMNTFIVKAEQRTKYEKEMWTIALREVVVTAPIIKKKEPRDDFWLNSSADYTITREIIDEYKFATVHNNLSLIPGFSYTVDMNGDFTYYLFGGPRVPAARIYIDGVSSDPKEANSLPVSAVESIDVVKYSAILGVRGSGGVISITTRRGGDPGPEKLNHTVYTPLGYQKPVEFYSPKYETLEARQSPIPDYRTTIFWKPDVVISEEEEKATFEFYSSDFPTTYSVVIEGITGDGKIVRQVEKIRIGE